MSNCEPAGGDPHHISDHPTRPDDHHIPLDPLLSSDTFIEDVNRDPLPQNGGPSEPLQNGARDPGPEVSNSTESTPPSGRRRPPPGFEPKRPRWLPEGWLMDCRVRSSGSMAGSIYRYYIEPLSGRRFRSKNEVDYFLETGSTRKRKQTPDAEVNSCEKPGGSKEKQPVSRLLNFDFNNVPEQVSWALTDASKDQWTPFMGDEMVSKSIRQEWKAAFNFLAARNT